jgi:type IV pilus assembly protein PilC
MRLAYTAYDGSGKTVTGVVDASDTTTGMDMLRRKGLYVAEIVAAAARVPKSARPHRRRLSGGQRLKSVAWFSRQLHVLICSGTQLADALHALERQTKPGPWRQVISGLRAKVEEGASLSEAMESYGDYFDPIYRSLVAAGESSGHLLEMLDKLASLKQKQMRIRNSVVGALIYPCMLTTVGTAIFAMLLIFVIPRFSGLFQTLDVPLPASTEILLGFSKAFRGYWWLALLLTAGLIAALVAYLRTPGGRSFRDTTILRVPCIGRVVRSFSTARIVSLLGVLMQAHIPVLEALRLVRLSAGNLRYEEIVSKAEDYVSRGEPMSSAFTDASLISPSVHEAIRSGEASGELDRLLLNIASFLDEENEVVIRSLTSIIEPVILIFMGILVGIVSICMFLPLFDLTAMTQGGGGG